MYEKPHNTANTQEIDRATNRWPNIRRFLLVDESTGWVDDDFCGWSWSAEKRLGSAERAVAYAEWAEFFEWRLGQQAAELAGDRVRRHLVEKWTDSMTYCCRRSAASAQGEDPGSWVSQQRRRPDLDAEEQAIVADIIAELDVKRRLAAVG